MTTADFLIEDHFSGFSGEEKLKAHPQKFQKKIPKKLQKKLQKIPKKFEKKIEKKISKNSKKFGKKVQKKFQKHFKSAPSVIAVFVSHPTAGGPVSVLHNYASLPASASMCPSPVEGKHSFHFSDSDFGAIPFLNSTAAADMQCPEMALKTYNTRGPYEITPDMHMSGLSVVEIDAHSSTGGRTHHSTPSSTLEATVLGTTASITVPTPRKPKFLSGPYTFTVHSQQAVVEMVPPDAPHPKVIQEVHVDSLDDPLASRQLSSWPQDQVDSLDEPMERDTSSGHLCIHIASMDLGDPVRCLATAGVFCWRVLSGSPQPDIASLDGMSTRVFDREHGY